MKSISQWVTYTKGRISLPYHGEGDELLLPQCHHYLIQLLVNGHEILMGGRALLFSRNLQGVLLMLQGLLTSWLRNLLSSYN